MMLAIWSLIFTFLWQETSSFMYAVPRNKLMQRLGLIAIGMAGSTEANTAYQNIARYLELKSRPAHVTIPRKRIELPFAVQLMRNSYNSADDLDFVPMNEFQKQFFLFRQREWDDYRIEHSSIMQGDLGDASYFDFISFAQYASIAEQMRSPRQEFIELVNAAGDAIIVKRPSYYQDDFSLPLYHSSLVGDKLFNFFYDTYAPILPNNQTFASIVRPSDKLDFFIQEVPSFLSIFTINSFSITPSAFRVESRSDKSAVLQVTTTLPANLWSLQVLMQRKDQPVNDFELKVLDAFARRVGLKTERLSVEVLNSLNLFYRFRVSLV